MPRRTVNRMFPSQKHKFAGRDLPRDYLIRSGGAELCTRCNTFYDCIAYSNAFRYRLRHLVFDTSFKEPSMAEATKPYPIDPIDPTGCPTCRSGFQPIDPP